MSDKSETEELKARLKSTWMAGDFGRVAKMAEGEAEAFIARRNIQPGTGVLDVACGTGNLAIPAARKGAIVTGVDIATNLVEQARARARSEGFDVRFDEGDAEALPYEDCSFDLVVSMWGAMFAPRPEIVTNELIRVCRSGGQIAMANWTPRGFIGQMFKLIAKHVPPPSGMISPIWWGDEDVVRERFRSGVVHLQMIPVIARLQYPFPPAGTVEFYGQYYGPTQRAFAGLKSAAQNAFRHDLETFFSEHNCGSGNVTAFDAEYLEVVAIRT
jgi:ubiquinone/menaquinone biosynthesis C-methylase UbiE